MADFRVTLQIAIQIHDGSVWLFERPQTYLHTAPFVGLCLIGNAPNVFGDHRGYDNEIVRIINDDTRHEVLCQVRGFRDATSNLEEAQENLGFEWKRFPTALAPPGTRLRDGGEG